MDNVSRQPPRYGGNPRVICHSCGQLGHYRPQCPNNNKGAMSNPIREQARFGERQDGRFETRNRGQQNPSPYQRHNRESSALTSKQLGSSCESWTHSTTLVVFSTTHNATGRCSIGFDLAFFVLCILTTIHASAATFRHQHRIVPTSIIIRFIYSLDIKLSAIYI